MIGASVAWHLAARGEHKVIVIDRDQSDGARSTAAATGGFRAQFATSINVRLSLLSREKFLRFQEEIGADPGYTPAGYLWIADDGAALDALRAARAIQHQEGLHEAVEVGPEDIARLQPAIARDGIAGGAYCPTDGFIKPRAIRDGYEAAAIRLGVDFVRGAELTGFDLGGAGRILAVRTTRGAIACDRVVNAAGAWAGVVARLAGVDVPVTPAKRQVAVTRTTSAIPSGAPMTIYCRDGFHFRERDGRVLLLRPGRATRDKPFDTTVEPAWLREIASIRNARVPILRDVSLDANASWAGLYEMSPDRHAIVGRGDPVSNLFLVNGSSGHGVMHAPALGQLLAEIILDGRASQLDVTALGPNRFTEGPTAPIPEVM